ncbi:hypothetical protein Hanom_Chr13g01192461 [Helianthus anomalus]
MFVKMLLLFGSYMTKFTLVLWFTNEYAGGYGTIYKAQSRTYGTGFVVKCKELSISVMLCLFGSTMSIDEVLFMMQMYSIMLCLLPLTITNSSYHLPGKLSI